MMTFMMTSFFITLTIGLYFLALKVFARFPSPFTMPVFLTTFSVIVVLLLSGFSYEEYTLAKDIMTFLLGPATVALAVPLYHHRKVISDNLLPIIIGISGGTLITIIVALFMALGLGLSTEMARAFSIKSITIPIASEVAPIIHADPSLVMMFVMITGMAGAMFGSFFLNLGKVHDPIARGLGYGTISHGIGTSQAVKEGDIAGASSSVAMGLAAIITSLIVPWLLPWLLF